MDQNHTINKKSTSVFND